MKEEMCPSSVQHYLGTSALFSDVISLFSAAFSPALGIPSRHFDFQPSQRRSLRLSMIPFVLCSLPLVRMKTRSEHHLPPRDVKGEDQYGASIGEEVRRELWEAMGDSPIGAALRSVGYLVRV
jgi:hypothetical protein